MYVFDSNEYYEALIAAFCLIAYTDSEIHHAEISRFVATLKEQNEFRNIDEKRLVSDIRDETARLGRDFGKGKAEALKKIQAVKNDYKIMEHVVKAARVALIADGKIHEAEETNLQDIHRALGITEDNR